MVVGEGAIDEVKLAVELTRQAADIRLEEGAVVERPGTRRRVRNLDHPSSKVDANRLAPGEECRHSAKFAAWATAGVQNSRVGRQVATNHGECLVEDRRRERSHQELVELG